MEIVGIRLLPVLVAAIATMVIGFLWYSPVLFARPWMLAMGYDPNDKARLDEMRKGAGRTYAIAFLASLMSAFVLAKIVDLTTALITYKESPLIDTWDRDVQAARIMSGVVPTSPRSA